ncbi:MAG: thiol:disulfide interchange protein [Muribaculaceae bacterium]|nr:thiol:disulfide interchange protein [Muribaculaceae bacterium]
MIRRLLIVFAVIAACVTGAVAQIVTPIKWSVSSEMTSSDEGKIVFHASIDKGWHLYGLTLPDGGPKATSVTFDNLQGMELVGELTPSEAPVEKVDMVFHLKLNWWENDVDLVQKFKVTGKSGYSASGVISFQGCNDGSCIPPTKEGFEIASPDFVASPVEEPVKETASSAGTPENNTSIDVNGWWSPVQFPESEGGDVHNIADSSWWYIFIWGFVGGLIALLTPCVWPMIPLTVSFFLKKNGSKGKSVRDAMIYGAGIIVIYLVLGLAITLIFGASKLNDLATNAVFNLIFFLLLVVFAISFFGAFDIKLPSKWSNGVDSKAEKTTGLISIFFMAFTLVLVSFSCTGPIIGTLLVEAASVGNITGPAIGMGAFALALAIPFTLFAIFPSWLKEMPRSGGWLNSVKVVLGFLELALSLKFLSVADLAYGWGILDREVFVSLWVVIFVLLGCYLLGKIRFSHDSELEHVSIGRFFLALFSFSFAVYLVPGLWGAPLKSVSAFVPPLYTQDFNLYAGGQFKEFDDYDEGMRYAAESGRPVLIDFSGYGCVNCRKMEGAVFDTEVISDIIKKDFVLIKLMVDDKQSLEQPITVEENGKKVKLTSVGDKWSYLQRSKFAANSQPYYVMLDNSGNPLATPYYYDEDVEKFGQWLATGIENYSKQ